MALARGLKIYHEPDNQTVQLSSGGDVVWEGTMSEYGEALDKMLALLESGVTILVRPEGVRLEG